MTEIKRPSKEFVYPGGGKMCCDGKVRATAWSEQILESELTLEQIEELARKGEWAELRGADTNKKNLIALTVYRHAKCGDLDEFTNTEGDFLSNGKLQNIHDSKFHRLLIQLGSAKKMGVKINV